MAQRSQMNAKEKLGREIDLTNASKDELIEHLCKIIEYEVEKGEDADYDLVRECSDWLDELTEDEVTFTPEELERKLAQLKAGSELKKPVKICKKAKLKTFVRVALIAAVIFAISLVSLSAVAVNKGYDSTWKYISVSVEKLLGMNYGEVSQEDDITFIKFSESIHYSSMSEMIAKERISIIYPQSMPSDTRITQVRLIQESEEYYTLYFVFSKDSYALSITNFYSIDTTYLSGFECITVNNRSFYVSKKEDNTYFAVHQYNGFEYTVQSSSYDDLLILISNMRG